MDHSLVGQTSDVVSYLRARAESGLSKVICWSIAMEPLPDV